MGAALSFANPHLWAEHFSIPPIVELNFIGVKKPERPRDAWGVILAVILYGLNQLKCLALSIATNYRNH
jgi:hypothetical protein